jgi:hypothetical protein
MTLPGYALAQNDLLNIVIDVEGTLVKRIPGRQKSQYDPNLIITNGLTYHIQPNLKEVLEQAFELPGVKIYFVDSGPEIWGSSVNKVLKTIKLDIKGEEKALFDLMAGSQKFDDVIDLSQLKLNKSNTLFIGDDKDILTDAFKANKFLAQRWLWSIPAWNQEVKDLISSGNTKASKIPKDEDEYNAITNKWSGIHRLLEIVIEERISDREVPQILASIAGIADLNNEAHLDRTLEIPQSYQNKLKLINLKIDLEELKVDFHRNLLRIYDDFDSDDLDSDIRYIISLEMLGSDELEDILSLESDIEDSLKEYLSLTSKEVKNVHKKYTKLKQAIAKFLKKNSPYNEVKKRSPYNLWQPHEVNKKVGFTLRDKNCFDFNTKQYLKSDATGIVEERCRPDTLYSWGDQTKLNVIESQMGNNKWADSFRIIFTTRSPIATFGYGPIPIRIKLKKGLKWVKKRPSTSCTERPLAERQTTIYYSNGYLLEFFICSPKIIHSWSYSTREHYDEVIKAYEWDTNQRDSLNFETYGSGDSSIFGRHWDGHLFTPSVLEDSLKLWIDRINAGTSKIYFNEDIPKHERTFEKHFETDKPIYYNER